MRLTNFSRFLLAATMKIPLPFEMEIPRPEPHDFYGRERGLFVGTRPNSTRRSRASAAIPQMAFPVSQRPIANNTSTTHAAIFSNMHKP